MSYDLCARSDDTHSRSVPRDTAAAVVAGMPAVAANGPAAFVMQGGDDVWMEIDLELVSEEKDAVEGDAGGPSPMVNAIQFHVPYAFTARLDACRATALQIAGALGWELYDLQLDAVVTGAAPPRRKPWWRFW